MSLDLLSRLHAALGDRYTIERVLGEGGMATVYLARDTKHDREVAIKLFGRTSAPCSAESGSSTRSGSPPGCTIPIYSP